MTAQGTDDKFVFEGVEYQPGDRITFTYYSREITSPLVFNGGQWLKTQGSDTVPLVYVIQKQQGDNDSILGTGVTNLRRATESDGVRMVSETSDADSRITALIREKTEIEATFEDFKRRVGLKAAELKAEHDWCEVVDDAMDELGIKMPSLKKNIRVSVTFDIVATPNNQSLVTEEWTYQSLLVSDNYIELDSDWAIHETVPVDYRVEAVTDADEDV